MGLLGVEHLSVQTRSLFALCPPPDNSFSVKTNFN